MHSRETAAASYCCCLAILQEARQNRASMPEASRRHLDSTANLRAEVSVCETSSSQVTQVYNVPYTFERTSTGLLRLQGRGQKDDCPVVRCPGRRPRCRLVIAVIPWWSCTTANKLRVRVDNDLIWWEQDASLEMVGARQLWLHLPLPSCHATTTKMDCAIGH